MCHHRNNKMLLPLVLASFFAASSGQRFDLSSLSLRAAAQAGGFNCAAKDVHFELVTGYVYTAPDDMLDSRPGTLMLTDCIDLCRRNATCKSANFETGLCVLFGSSEQEVPGENCLACSFLQHLYSWSLSKVVDSS